MPSAAKRRKLDSPQEAGSSDSNDSEASDVSSSESAHSASESDDTEDEIHNMKRKKSMQTSKRKHRATTATNFGSTLQSLLETDTPSNLPLSLKPSVVKQARAEKEKKQSNLLSRQERKEHEDACRVTDVIGGWGAESERELRKVAQRGVVKLFNVIQQSQAADAEAAAHKKASRGSGKPSLPAPSTTSGTKKDKPVTQNEFFSMLKAGAVVSKS